MGVVDVTRGNKEVDSYSKEKFEEIADYNKAIKELSTLKEATTAKKEEIPTELAESIIKELAGGDSLVAAYNKRVNLSAELNSKIKDNNLAKADAAPWGIFTNEEMLKITSLGIKPRFYVSSEKSYNPTWEEQYPIHILNTINGKVYFVILQPANEPLVFKEQEVKFPDESIDVLEARGAKLEEQAITNSKEILSFTSQIETLEAIKDELFAELDLYLANNKSKKEAEETIAIFEAFAPTESDATVTKYLEDNNVYYLKDAAKTEDNPPVKLKNNFFGKLYEPIGELYMLPNYGELDLTMFFAPFYMLFFGLCLGDMGYGIILLIVGLVVNFKMPKFANYGKLIAWLGLGTIIMPALNGTIFGAKLYDIIPMKQSIRDLFFTDMNMFWFAIIFGLVQIVFARLLNAFYAIKTKGLVHGIANIGWAICITWASIMYGAMEMQTTTPEWLSYIGYFGLALIILFSSDSKNIIVRLFKGTFSLYDSTSVFGDMLSYIRLFGLGTAGGILGLVVNSVAFQLYEIPYVGWLFTLLMLLVGHTAVLLLSSLGAFVHPMRLTFVEFYKNAGFEGGGRAYSPLTKEKNN